MNDENLKKGNPDTQFRSGREAVENGRKGGKASGVSRGFKSALKKRLKAHPELYDSIIDTLTDKAVSGDLKAIEMLTDLNDESVQRENLKLKRQELKLKKQQLDCTSSKTEVTFIDDLQE